MYAETFNVRAWLETPAKWLRWAMQSLQASNQTDAQYNLQQFWTSLAPAKTQAKTAQDWSEVLTLDAQSQWTLGNLYQAEASDVLKQINATYNKNFWLDPVQAVKDLAGSSDPSLIPLRTKLDGLNKSAAAAFAAQVQLAAQAQAAAASAGVQSQAAATLHVGQNAQTAAANDAALALRQADTAGKAGMTFADMMKTPFLGMPAWAWIAGGAAVLLLITTAPAMAEASAVRRAVEE